MKSLPKITLTIYTIVLLWLILFKTSLDIPAVLAEFQKRSLNLIPFTGHWSEMIENFIVFIPMGLLLGGVFKEIAFWKKLTLIFVFSIVIETTQYVLAIGVSDITDVITNTLGGLLGLMAYKISADHGSPEKTNRVVLLATALLVAICLFLRFFVFRVKY